MANVECYNTDDGLQVTIGAGLLRSDQLVSSVRYTSNPVHTRIKVWNRGGLAGELVVNTADADAIICRLLGCTQEGLAAARDIAVVTKYADGRL